MQDEDQGTEHYWQLPTVHRGQGWRHDGVREPCRKGGQVWEQERGQQFGLRCLCNLWVELRRRYTGYKGRALEASGLEVKPWQSLALED